MSDNDSRGDAKLVNEAAKASGMDSHLTELPGAHDWWLFASALRHELSFLLARPD